MIMRKKTSLHGQGTNYPVHGLSQLLLVHNRKHESKERLDLGKNSLNRISHPPKKDMIMVGPLLQGRFFWTVMQITWSCYHRQREYQYQYAWCEDCLPSEPFQSFKLYNQENSICQTCISIHIRSTPVNTQAWVDNFVHLFCHRKP